MNDPRPQPRPWASQDDPVSAESEEALSAYLSGELTDEAAAAFERRLDEDPQLARRLDALAGVLTSLGGADAATPPDGFSDRLEARLAAERSLPSLDAARRRRTRWSVALSSAAGVVMLAVAGVQVLGGPLGDVGTGGEQAMERQAQDSALSLAAPEAAREEADAGAESSVGALRTGDDGATGGAGGSASADSAPAPSAGDPAGASGPEPGQEPDLMEDSSASDVRIADDGAAFSHDDELLAHFQGRGEAERLRGVSRDQAAELAVRHAESVRAAAPFTDGTPPAACLDEVLGPPAEARVVARVELVRWQGGTAVAYLVGRPSAEASAIDGFELWVTAPTGCDVRRFLSWR